MKKRKVSSRMMRDFVFYHDEEVLGDCGVVAFGLLAGSESCWLVAKRQRREAATINKLTQLRVDVCIQVVVGESRG